MSTNHCRSQNHTSLVSWPLPRWPQEVPGQYQGPPNLSCFPYIFQKGQMFLQPEPEPVLRPGEPFPGSCLPLPADGSAERSLQPLALAVKWDSWPCSRWPLGSGLRAIPRPPGWEGWGCGGREPDTFN